MQTSRPNTETGPTSAAVLHLTMALGGLTIAIELKTPALADPLLKRYAPYLSVGQCEVPGLTLTFEQDLDPARLKNWQAPLPASPITVMGIPAPSFFDLELVRGEGGAFSMEAAYLYGEYDGQQNATMTLYTENTHSIVPYFEHFFVCLYIDFALRHDRIVLHASGILDGDEALLFSGPSGAGKTTMVENSPGRTILSDELVVVSHDRETNTYFAHGTPFFGSWGQLGAPVKAPLKAIHFLQKTPHNELSSLRPSECFRRLCQVICTINPSAELTQEFLSWAEALTPKCRLLSFAPSEAIWSLLSEDQATPNKRS